MGTSNFHTHCGALYVIEQETNEIQEWIKELDSSFDISDYLKSYYELRSFPTVSVGSFEEDLTYLNHWFRCQINIFHRAGYCEGSNLDYEVTWYCDQDDYEFVSDVISALNDEYYYHKTGRGLWRIHRDSLENKLDALQKQLVAKVEVLLERVTTPYVITASFSNGETWYERKGE